MQASSLFGCFIIHFPFVLLLSTLFATTSQILKVGGNAPLSEKWAAYATPYPLLRCTASLIVYDKQRSKVAISVYCVHIYLFLNVTSYWMPMNFS